jgi:pyruvate,water dikinase
MTYTEHNSLENSRIVWLQGTNGAAIEKVGGKGANLAELISAGIPVPPGFVVPTDVYREFLDITGLSTVLPKLLEGLDIEETVDLEARSEEIRSAIMDKAMPAEVATAIADAYHQLVDGKDTYVAIRSSATAEDLIDTSFAGQYATYLNVSGADEVIKAVQSCWASLLGARATFYRTTHGFADMSIDLAVIVQRMVQSEKAGVMFTLHPTTGNPEQIEISAAYGLGEAVVSGSITSDTYLYDKNTGAISERSVVTQKRLLVRKKGSHSQDNDYGENSWEDVPVPDSGSAKLTDQQIEELAAIGRKVETHYGYPQDIEWAFEQGCFYLTQTRPVTVKSIEYSLDDDPLATESAEVLLTGQSASPGVGAGHVRILAGPDECNLLEPGEILVAKMTTPDYVPAMQRAAGIVTEQGSRTCHAAIVSRELGLPCIVGAEGALETLQNGDLVTLDGSHGQIFEGVAETRLAWGKKREEELIAKQSEQAAIETKTKVMVILADPEQAQSVAHRNVDGVGLLRAEFILARIGKHPRKFIQEGQGEEYIQRLTDGIMTFCTAFDSRPVVYRLLDFKTNELANLEGGKEFEGPEENPMLGFRGAARYTRDPEVFALEIEAIKRVRAKFKNLYVMIPFVRTPLELREVIELMAKHDLKRSDDFKLWIMAELPSNVLILDKFIDEGIDGISIGSNDLTQLILGMDRDNERLTNIGDERNEAVMQAFEMLITTAKSRGITASICGQAPSDFPEITEKLVAWGITSISVSPDMIERTRQIVKACEDKDIANL